MRARSWIVLGVWGAVASVALAGTPLAHVSHLEKEVTFRAPGGKDWQPAKASQALEQGAQVKTGAGARAEVTYANGAVLRIAESSTLALTQQEDKGWGRLLFGKLWIKAVKGKKLNVVTPSATAAVTGTEFLLMVDDDQNTKIIVFDGAVRFTGSLGDSITVKKAQWGLAKPEVHLKPPQPAPLDDVRKAEPWINNF